MQPDLDRSPGEEDSGASTGGPEASSGSASSRAGGGPAERPGRLAQGPSWRARRTEDGSYTLAHPLHGETCHSDAGAWQEARERYALPCGLASRASAASGGGAGAVRLLDVGTGIGLNLAAALEQVEGAGGALLATSLELDPAVIEAGLELPDPLGLVAWTAVRASLRAALADRERAALPGGVPLGTRSRLRLLLGDARETLPGLGDGARFDAVFLDPFSPRRERALWAPEFLAEVARHMAPGAVLSTYSAARSARAGLAAAGLAVGIGPPVGRKREGTLARKGGNRIGAGNWRGAFAYNPRSGRYSP
jgi:tRNA U34 5-methylaminomethyl-2-thiouridine-forming methyltransferase MnmC